jgi:hypothetical protein
MPGREGAGRLGCLLAVAALAFITYVGIPALRLEIRYRSARETIHDEAAQITAERAADVEREIVFAVRKLDLPRSAERVQVRHASGGLRRFQISVRYADTVRVLAWAWVWQRTIQAQTP